MEPTDLTIQILREIRDEIRTTRTELSARIDQTNARLDETNVRMDQLERRQAESEIRLSTELVAVANAVKQVRDLLADRHHLEDQVADHEKRIRSLEQTTHA